jgi:hypothetical protein
MLSSLREFWYESSPCTYSSAIDCRLPDIGELLAGNLARDRASLVSVTIIEGAGHYVSIF